ncbi:MAG: hypothetical protein JOZ69_09640 [Myxococcales bacterium]|nr:hypothetical protein [Myxococcales bacterium]
MCSCALSDPSGATAASGLAQGTSSAALTSPLAGYAGTTDGDPHVDFLDPNGDVHELRRDASAGWADGDLTVLTGAPAAGTGSALDAYVGSDGDSHVDFVDGAGHVHELHSGTGGWVDEDLTAAATPDDVPSADPPVAAASPHALAGYAETGYNANRHVDFLDANGHVHDLFGAASWVDVDLTARTHAPPARAGSAIAGYWGSNGSQHVDYVDASLDVHELSIRPGGFWSDLDLTAVATGAPAAPGASLVGYWGSDDGQPIPFGSNAGVHVDFVDLAGHVHQLQYRSGNLVDDDLTCAAHGTPAWPSSALAGYRGGNGDQRVVFVDAGGAVRELSSASGAAWVEVDLTAGTGNVAPVSMTAGLAAFAAGDGSRHVDYVTTNGGVTDLAVP